MTRRMTPAMGAGCLALLAAVLTGAPGGAQPVPASASAAPEAGAPAHGPLIERYCVTCHNGRLRTAGVVLEGLDVSNVAPGAATWERVVRKLQAREMPPAGRPRPDDAEYDALTAQLTAALDLAAAREPNPGRGALHRLNRTEYANVVRDLLALDVDVTRFLPPDDSSYGFDNIADVLRVSPLLLEQYLSAARAISRAAVGSPAVRAATDTYRTAPDHTQDYPLDGLPFGTRGGLAARHYFPLDAEYEVRAFLKRTAQTGIRGLGEAHDVEIAVDGVRAGLFRVGGPDFYDQIGDIRTVVGVTKAFTADEVLRVRVPVAAGFHEVSVSFLKQPSVLAEELDRPFLASYRADPVDGLPHVDRMTVSGPHGSAGPGATPSRERIFTCRPAGDDEAEARACASSILETLARRAFRRPVSAADLDVLLPFYDAGRAEGGFEAGVETALRRILVDPEFIFRAERDPDGVAPAAAYALSDLELASRLSFFLWSSVPDDELLDVAARGELGDPAELRRQVRRMLADSRSAALVDNFAVQWLLVRNLGAARPTPSEFPDFDDNLRQAFARETTLFVESILRDDRSVVDLLDADYTFVNERLARHYGIPDVYGDRFRRVDVADEHRRGLLGHGSVLTVTSYPNRTSPVLRGKWVLDNILGAPPPPPPPDVPDLEENPVGEVLPMRERMAHHRRNAICASCHARMDPLGLALENFDANGRWRVAEGENPIDASAELADGTSFAGPAGLRALLLRRPQQFAETVTAKLLTFALGRGLEHYDAPAIRAILRDAEPRRYTFSALIEGIVESVPFRMRRAASAAIPAASAAP
ncbi:MAG: DUF1592 domain-containing protein [Acidobacteria bacterium]|nr:DUF1592 domain-containing protein [Acidobacteriota bacterium]